MSNIKTSTFFLIGLFLAILPYGYLCFFAQPVADDFGFSHAYQINDFWQLLKTSYLKMNGRYISNFLMYLNPISFGSFLGYKLIPLLLILLTILGNLILINVIFSFLSKKKQLTFALVLSLLFFQNMPIISEGLYWYTAAIIYQGGIIFTILYVAAFIKVIGSSNNIIGKLILTLLLFIVCGFNEVLSLLIPFFLCIITIIAFRKNKIEKKEVLWQFLFSIIFASFLIFSPGNWVREAMYQNNNNFIYSFSFSFLQTIRFSFYWVASLVLFPASILYYQLHQKWREHSILVKNSFHLNRWVSIALLFSVIFICVFPVYWSTGILGQHRTLNVAYAFFLPLWFINLSIWFNYYDLKVDSLLTRRWNKGLYTLLLIAIIFNGNGYHSLKDIFSGDAKAYSKQLSSRIEKLSKIKKTNTKEIIFSPLKSRPTTLFVTEISTDPSFWTNQGYNTYFRLIDTKIYIKKE